MKTIEEDSHREEIVNFIENCDLEKPIEIIIHSDGGGITTFQWFAHWLKDKNYRITVLHAMSAAVDLICLLDPKRIKAASYSIWMTHPVQSFLSAELGKRDRNHLNEYYNRQEEEATLPTKGKLPDDVYEKSLTDDVFFTTADALKWGLISEII